MDSNRYHGTVTFVLADGNRNEIRRLHQLGNLEFLNDERDETEFPTLSQFDSVSPTYMNWSDMDQLINELAVVRGTLIDEPQKQHLDDIVALAKECQQTPGSFLAVL